MKLKNGPVVSGLKRYKIIPNNNRLRFNGVWLKKITNNDGATSLVPEMIGFKASV